MKCGSSQTWPQYWPTWQVAVATMSEQRLHPAVTCNVQTSYNCNVLVAIDAVELGLDWPTTLALTEEPISSLLSPRSAVFYYFKLSHLFTYGGVFYLCKLSTGSQRLKSQTVKTRAEWYGEKKKPNNLFLLPNTIYMTIKHIAGMCFMERLMNKTSVHVGLQWHQ